MLFQDGDYVEGHVGENRRRAIGGAPVAADGELDLVVGEWDRRPQPAQHGAERVCRRCEHRHGIARHVLGDHAPFAVVNDPTRRRKRHLAQAIGLALQHVLRVLQNLGAEERAEQQDEPYENADRGDLRTPRDVVRMKAHDVILPPVRAADASSPTEMTPAAAVTAPERGAHTKISCARSTPLRWCSANT